MACLPAVCLGQPSEPDYKMVFQQAEKFANSQQPTDETDRKALDNYRKVIRILSSGKIDNPFLFQTYIAFGAFLQVLDRQREAIPCFERAFVLKKLLPALKDSVLFRPLVYCGNSYYRLDKLDSAQLRYKQAEQLAEKYPAVSELERLYNTLGVIAYSTGDYTKSITYYSRAVSTLNRQKHPDKSLLVTYLNNQAMAYRRLNRYPEALDIYKRLMPYNLETDKLLHNIGSVYLAMDQPATAVTYLKKINYEDQKKLNDLGLAYIKQGQPDMANFYLKKALSLSEKLYGAAKNSDRAITLKYTGDVLLIKHEPGKAIGCYQQAIKNLLFDFNSDDIYTNPASFSSAFYTAELMETLLTKAGAFATLYNTSHKIKDLDAALQTYLSFYKLTGFIERFYESDAARMFISTKKNNSHQKPIALCLKLYNLTRNRKYIEQAFLLDEQNKANTLSLYLQENDLKIKSGVPASLLAQEADLKKMITAMVLKATGATNTDVLKGLKDSINGYSLQLIKVQDKINGHIGPKKFNLEGNRISITDLQKIIPDKGAVLSYHIGEKEILAFAITQDGYDFFNTPIDENFLLSLRKLYDLARSAEGNTAKGLKKLSRQFYKQLIQPAEPRLDGKTQLVIIPDDELNYLPFELLTNADGTNLLSHYAIAYNYACALLQNNVPETGYRQLKKLGMAPFNQKISGSEWPPLPSSKQEIDVLNGVALIGKDASKQHFLQQAGQYGIIHLATHAYASDRDPDRSFIAFYPSDSTMADKLFLPEIYNLKLDKARLMILSACETGTGELVKGEGLMSLSRAFSYAGCMNTIASTWMANDNATAFIAKRLHHYLTEDYSTARALQQAKMDYLADGDVPATLKKPAYWAHLRLIGGFEQDGHISLLWYAGILPVLALSVFIVLKGRKRFKRFRPAASNSSEA